MCRNNVHNISNMSITFLGQLMPTCNHNIAHVSTSYMHSIFAVYQRQLTGTIITAQPTRGFPSFARAFGEDFEVLRSQAEPLLTCQGRSAWYVESYHGQVWQFPRAVCRSRLGKDMPISALVVALHDGLAWSDPTRGHCACTSCVNCTSQCIHIYIQNSKSSQNVYEPISYSSYKAIAFLVALCKQSPIPK